MEESCLLVPAAALIVLCGPLKMHVADLRASLSLVGRNLVFARIASLS